MAPPFTVTGEGVRLSVRLTPRASQARIEGLVAGADGRQALQVRVKAKPAEGEANAALLSLLVAALGLRKADVRLAAGATSRLKLVDIKGDPQTIVARLQAVIAAASG